MTLPTELRFAKAGESIKLLGDEQETVFKEGELAYFDAKGAYNIDLNYRDSVRTAVTNQTKNLLINVEGVYDIDPTLVESVLRETCDRIISYCGGTVEIFGVQEASQ